MTEDETLECIRALKELFPKADLSDSEMEAFGFELGTKYSRADAIDVIRGHRLKNDFLRPKLSVILEELDKRRGIIRAESSRQKVGTRTIDAQKTAMGRSHGRDYSTMGDVEFVLRFTRAMWKLYARPYEQTAGTHEHHRSLMDRRIRDISREATCMLVVDCGMDRETAEQSLSICYQHSDQTFDREAKEWNAWRSEANVAKDLEGVW